MCQRPLLFLLLLFQGFTITAQNKPTPDFFTFNGTPSVLRKCFSANWYDRYQGATRVAVVRALQDNDWQAVDSTYGMPDEKDGIRRMRLDKVDLAPYVNNDGYIVYWVPEVPPQFPGGEKGLQQYMNDVLHQDSAMLDNGLYNAVYISCIIGIDGQTSEVAEASPHRESIPAVVAENCLDAVRYMPPWTPALFNSKPVRVCRLIVFLLKK